MTAVVKTPWQELRELLLKTGTMAPDWAQAGDAVPRGVFLPDLMWPFDNDLDIPVSKTADPEAWSRWADSNVPITTQWDDGHHTGTAPGEWRTSSSSTPSLVFSMFRDLSVFDGARVLEIGTGTGWCAGLLSARLGERNVVSVELDEAVADRAREALHAAGWHPEIVTGDGLLGWPNRAPYDRILVTWPESARCCGPASSATTTWARPVWSAVTSPPTWWRCSPSGTAPPGARSARRRSAAGQSPPPRRWRRP